MTIDTGTAAIAELMGGVTPGPWNAYAGRAIEASGRTIADVWSILPEVSKAEQFANARFVAAAREMVPALAAERDALRAEVNRLRVLLRNAREWNWIDFEENCDNEEYLVCVPTLVKLNADIDAALKGAANG